MSAPLLQVRDVQTWFPVRRGIFSRTVAHVKAVDGVSLTVKAGEILGLVGESGCGKSTLARTIALLDRPRAGEALFDGVDLFVSGRASIRAVRRRLQIVFQDPFASLNPRMTVAEIVAEGPVAHGLVRRRERMDVAAQLLHEVGLNADALHRYPHEFSGGQRQRIAVARAIAMRPELVICDEAVSALDVSVQAQVINLLMDLRRKLNLSYVFISHDIGVVRHVSDRVAVMYLGRIVEEGPTEAVIDAPRHPYTQALASAIPRVGEDRKQRIVLQGDVPSPVDPPPGCPFHPRCPFATEACKHRRPELEPCAGSTPDHRTACVRQDDLPAHH